jgi:hypothetical protein
MASVKWLVRTVPTTARCRREGGPALALMRLILADHDITMGPGEVAEFDTRLPHWFGPAGDRPVEILSLFGRQGERIHVRAAPRGKARTV